MLSSRERLLLTINHKEPDHVPLSFRWIIRTFLKDRAWRDQFERVRMELELGLDPILELSYTPAWKMNPDVKVKLWRDSNAAGEQYPLLFKEYHTKKGVLKQVVRQTADWPHGDWVPLWSDHMIPRSRTKKYLIEDLKDLEALKFLFNEPTDKENRKFLEEAENVKRFADKYGVLVENATLRMGDAVPYSLGIENMILASFKNPSLIHEFLDILLEWNTKYLRRILETGVVDVISCDAFDAFFPPRLYKIFIVPRLRKLIEMVHRSGAKLCYGPRAPPLTLFSFFKEMGVDIFWGCDPIEGKEDPLRVKQEAGDKICIWGGVNSYVTLGTGTKDQIEKEVTNAIRILGPGGGFILSAIDSLDKHTPWSNIQHMIKVWRKLRKYPLA